MGNSHPTSFTADDRPTKMTVTRRAENRSFRHGVFDRSVSEAEHLQNSHASATSNLPAHYDATNQLFAIFLPNAEPTVMRATLCGERSVGVVHMISASVSSPLALRPREAAKTLGISPRLLWQLTK